MTQHTDVVVVGGGQAGLAAGYHLRRQGLDHVILDAGAAPVGSPRPATSSPSRPAAAPDRGSGSGGGQPRRSSRAAMAATTDGATW
ncbi:hypothetical protein ADK58_03635 [Streptomyces sp. XY152]|nr:hypothetical protein ADK58_03635 [Streptomyces sp. XY152]